MSDIRPTGNIFTRYLRESVQELKLVTWPTRQEVLRDTVTVLVISIIVGLFLGGLDYGFSNGMEALLARAATL